MPKVFQSASGRLLVPLASMLDASTPPRDKTLAEVQSLVLSLGCSLALILSLLVYCWPSFQILLFLNVRLNYISAKPQSPLKSHLIDHWKHSSRLPIFLVCLFVLFFVYLFFFFFLWDPKQNMRSVSRIIYSASGMESDDGRSKPEFFRYSQLRYNACFKNTICFHLLEVLEKGLNRVRT